jgi:hypothetical protein
MLITLEKSGGRGGGEVGDDELNGERRGMVNLKIHKHENHFCSNFEFSTFVCLIVHNYYFQAIIYWNELCLTVGMISV